MSAPFNQQEPKMNTSSPAAPVRRLRQRLIDDMTMRRFSPETQRNYIRDVGRFATFLRRSPDTATAEDLRRFQLEQREAGVPVPTMNSIVSALRSHPRANREPTRVTRHAWPPFPAAAPSPRPIFGLAPSIAIEASKASVAGHPRRNARPIGPWCGASASRRPRRPSGRVAPRISRKPKSP